MASNDADYQPKSKQSKFAGAKEFLYNPQTHAVVGRTCGSWAKIGLFYLVFYSCLAGFFAIWLSIFFLMIDSTEPRQHGMTSLLKNNPGMGFRPQPDVERTLIRFEQGKPESYTPYTTNLKSALEPYEHEGQDGENYDDCSAGIRPPNKVCRFVIDDLGDECTNEKDYGYDEGQPCVLIKLNRVYGYVPQPFNDTNPPPEEALKLGLDWTNDTVGVTCEGENPADLENIGPIEFWPKGFHMKYFPYMNLEGYRQPIIMVKFKKPKNGVVIQVWCKAWAQNIYHHKNDKAGSVHFELLVD